MLPQAQMLLQPWPCIHAKHMDSKPRATPAVQPIWLPAFYNCKTASKPLITA